MVIIPAACNMLKNNTDNTCKTNAKQNSHNRASDHHLANLCK